jgi:hypothetical protein
VHIVINYYLNFEMQQIKRTKKENSASCNYSCLNHNITIQMLTSLSIAHCISSVVTQMLQNLDDDMYLASTSVGA